MPRNNEDTTSTEEDESNDENSRFFFPSLSNCFSTIDMTRFVTIVTLIYVNFINYMDRSTLAGMTSYITRDPHFHFDENEEKYLGFLQSAFVFGYMICAPLFGYLGDRYNRKWILLFGISFWSLSTLLGSAMNNYWWFLFFRAMVGVGEASYSTIAPAIISDLFSKDNRSRVLALFYFAIPVGTGLGYIVGSKVAAHSSDWRWGLRITPFMGLVAIILIIFFMVDPPRGQSEGNEINPSSPKEDLQALSQCKSFVLLTCGFTCVTFCAGALMWWGPRFAFLGAKVSCGNTIRCHNIKSDDISYKFGIVMTLAGLIGVPGGSYVSQFIRQKVPNADPLVCAYTLILSVPVLFFGLISAQYSMPWCYGLTFLAGLLLNCNWSIVSDITLYVVIPPRRSFASATQILFSHFLGDAFSPFLIGVVADAIQPNIQPVTHQLLQVQTNDDPFQEEVVNFVALQYALFACCFFQAAGAACFFVMSFYILDDRKEAERAVSAALHDDDSTAPVIRNMYVDEEEEDAEGLRK